MFPLNDGGIISGLLCGILFGYVLERAGFGSPCKLTAQFRFNDWSVFKVMFTAIAVAAVGLYLLRLSGLMASDSVFVPSALLMAAGIGGALVGAGFAIGGYCPGTSIVGLFSGRLDALIFIIGLLLGTVVFAGLYGPTIESIMAMSEVQTGDTLVDAYAFSEPIVLACILAALAGVFVIGSWFERRSAGGPVSAEEAVNGIPSAPPQ